MMPDLFVDQMMKNPNLLVRISQPATRNPLSVRGLLVQPPQFSAGAEYNLMYEIASSAVEKTGFYFQQIQSFLNRATGTEFDFSLKSQGLSQVRWTSSKHFALSVSFLLLAPREAEARDRVQLPGARIMGAPFPEIENEGDSDVFKPPGGYSGITKKNDKPQGLYSVSVGRWFAISNYLVLVDSQTQHLQATTTSGLPFKAVVTMSFQSYLIPSRQRVERWFMGRDLPQVSSQDVESGS